MAAWHQPLEASPHVNERLKKTSQRKAGSKEKMEKNCGRGISLTRGPVGSGLLLRLVELGLVDAVHLRRLVAHGSVRAGKKHQT